MVEKELNVRGEFSTGTVLAFVLGVVIVVVVVLGVTGVLDPLFGRVGTVDPGDLQVFASACAGYAEANLLISFCEFREIDVGGDDDVYLNCLDDRLKASLEDAGVNRGKFNCNVQKTAKAFCEESISSSRWDKTTVNGVYCAGGLNAKYADCANTNGANSDGKICLCGSDDVECAANRACRPKTDGTGECIVPLGSNGS